MSRTYAKIYLAIWNDDDFLALPDAAQAMYFRLLTASSLNTAGVADWRPNRIAKKAADLTVEKVRAAADALAASRFVIYDDETEEILLRTFIKHDEVMKSPNLAAAVQREYGELSSPTLRRVFLAELLKLHDQEPNLRGWERVSDLIERARQTPPEDLAETLRVTLRETLPETVTRTLPETLPERDPLSLNPQPTTSSPDPNIGRAAKITSTWMQACKTKPPKALTGKVRVEVQQLLDEGFDPDLISRGLDRWRTRGNLGPSLIPNLVNEVANTEQPQPAQDWRAPEEPPDEVLSDPDAYRAWIQERTRRSA